MERLTPAMQQYLEIKADYRDAILFFRIGDFYEMFFDDARLASGILGIALTSRDRGRKIPMCGVPYHAAGPYIAKLVKEGYKVALCEQTEDAEDAEGVVERAVMRVVTPGTVLEEELLDVKSNNYIAAATWNGKTAGFACMDITTGEFRAAELDCLESLHDEIKRIGPSELLIAEGGSGVEADWMGLNAEEPEGGGLVKNITRLSPYDFLHDISLERLCAHFGVSSVEGFGLGEMKEGVRAAGALLFYAKKTQKKGISHIKRCAPYWPGNFLVMDHATRRNLEIFENTRTLGREGTLLGLLDRTRTPMGGRKLRNWLLFPLLDTGEIKERLLAVEELIGDRVGKRGIEGALSQIRDMERLSARVAVGLAGPKDLVSLKESLEKAGALKGLLKGFSSRLLTEAAGRLDGVPEVTSLIEAALSHNPPHTVKDGGFIREGFSKELDEFRRLASGGKEWLARLEAGERERTAISTLKVGYNRVFGYYIEVTNPNLKNIPRDYIRKQTLVNAERFVTPELKEWESKILTAEERAKTLEGKLFLELTEKVSAYTERVQRSADIAATVDVLTAFASVAGEMNYTRPEVASDVTPDGAIVIEEGRHPVIEKYLKDGFVPNDFRCDIAENQILVLTGPNMAGKSTYIRQCALIVLMAQIGSFVPAKRAAIAAVDRIFTRVGASDDISRGQSTFMVEMNETANILNNATPRSLVILDEIGRGTATFDGLSIAWAVLEYIHDNPAVRAKTLFATHYHELTELSLTKERVKNYNMMVKEWNGRVIFLRKVVPGGANRSYGIQVARLAGLPLPVIERAGEVLANLERGELNGAGLPRIAQGRETQETGAYGQMNLPNPADSPNGPMGRIKEEILKLDINTITPVEALNILSKIRGILGE